MLKNLGEIGKSEAAKRMWDKIYNAVSKDPDNSLRQLIPSNASKVVDENGEPLVVYHGTNASNITSFSLEKAKHNTGIFLSKSKNVARSYVDWMNVDYYGTVLNHELDDFSIYESYDEYKNRTLESGKDENLPFSGLIPEEVFNAKSSNYKFQ